VIDQRVLLDDGAIVVVDARCHDAPRGSSGEEVARTTEVSIPLCGFYVRSVRRAARPGPARVTIGDPGRALVFRRGEPYRVSHPIQRDDRSLVIALRVQDPGLERAGADDRAISPRTTLAARQLARGLLGGWIDALGGAELALSLVRAVGAELAAGRTAPAGRDRRLASAVRLEIAGRLGERMTLPELGRLAGLSGWEVARRFRRATGTSIHAYRTRLRVQAALERIEAGESDLTGLALELGFADHSHMTNTVRRATGRAPSAFRRPPTAAELRTILQA
jgi:AraC family transcriptional regulator